MKTAEEILREIETPYVHIANEAQFDHLRIDISLEDAIQAMKLYANQKLDEAADRADVIDDAVDRKTILSLKDKV